MLLYLCPVIYRFFHTDSAIYVAAFKKCQLQLSIMGIKTLQVITKLSLCKNWMICIYYVHMNTRNHTDIDMCYLSSIIRINHIVVYMQQIHSKYWSDIPHMITKTNCNFKTTQPQGTTRSNIICKKAKWTKLLSHMQSHITIHPHFLNYPNEFYRKWNKGTKLFSQLNRHSTLNHYKRSRCKDELFSK